ncbi:tetratricopeptide repeat protein [Candidatus Gottesmanbacteria bacterium]|nr:tetratricopeptide repeat protein [Candidatus Gottesmanbacteria bacterium]
MHPAQKQTFFDHIGRITLVALTGLTPVFFLPLTQDFYDTNKWLLLMVAAILILAVSAGKNIVNRTLTYSWNSTTQAVSFILLSSVVSLIIASPNRVEAILNPFGAGSWLALFLMLTLGPSFLTEKSREAITWVLYAVVSLLGLIAIYQFFGLSRVIGLAGLPGLAFLADPLWSPMGTSVGLLTVLAVSLPLLIAEILHRKKQGADMHMIAAAIMTTAVSGGLILTLFQALPPLLSGMLPYWAAWQILLESYKNVKQLLVGVGAENFLAAFTLGRPMALNMGAAWSSRYSISSSLLFHSATIYGVAGLVTLGYFLLSCLQGKLTWNVRTSRIIAVLALILLPPSLPAFVFIIIVLLIQEPHRVVHVPVPERPWIHWLLAGVTIVLTLTSSYGLYRVYAAELSFGTSLKAIEKREGTAAYNAQIAALTQSPYIARFHTAYSQTNLALANALSQSATSSASADQVKKDRETATQLVQQAIREAKLGVSLAPNNIQVWENIASVYQTLTGIAQGADQWTIAAYQQAMQLDPTNPTIRLRLGGAYVGQQKFDQATQSYTAAIQLKPDYANAYYNLAFVYRQTKKYLPAALATREALKYVTPGSDDVKRGNQELSDLRELLTTEEKKVLDNPDDLVTPTPTTEPTKASKSKTSIEPLSPLP